MDDLDTIVDPVLNEKVPVTQRFETVQTFLEDTNAIVKMTLLEGVLHSIDDKPAYREIIRDTGQETWLKWFRHGLEHRDGKPSSLSYFRNGKLSQRVWKLEGQQHRIDGPSCEEFDEDTNNPTYLEFKQNDVFFRRDGPACLHLCPRSGIVTGEDWHTIPDCGLLHRTDGPAIVCRDKTTGISSQGIWVQKGKLFRPEGKPPVIFRDPVSGATVKEAWEHEDFPKQRPSAPFIK